MNVTGQNGQSGLIANKGGYTFFQQVKAGCLHPAIMLYLNGLSEKQRLKSMFKTATEFWRIPYKGEKVLLIALFQKGKLRPDTQRMLEAAKRKGIYVIAINSLKLSAPEELRHCIDLYIERFNFGRDFGSYKHGFLDIFKSGLADKCPRLLMLNDSVFYSTSRIENFLDEMMESDVEVLGGTENYEISYHLGSFCIAFAGNILRHKRFQKYWKSYRLSDVRPKVIKRGEMGLSKALMKCTSDQTEVKALYNSFRFLNMLQKVDTAELDDVIRLSRRSALTPAKRFSLANQVETAVQEYTGKVQRDARMKIENSGNREATKDRMFLYSLSDVKKVFEAHLKDAPQSNEEYLKESVIAGMVDNFRQHSQIHQNAANLLYMGCPIVKLDGVFRGVFNMLDVKKICSLLTPQESAELEYLLLSRPYGGDTLIGWKHAAFIRGLL